MAVGFVEGIPGGNIRLSNGDVPFFEYSVVIFGNFLV
jgi:hypothetical protein